MRWLGLAVLAAVGAMAEQTVPAGDASLVARLGRVFEDGIDGLGLSWLGGGVRVSHTGSTLRATFGVAAAPFRVGFYQSDEGYMPFEGVAWVPASGLNETVVVGAGAGVIDVVSMPLTLIIRSRRTGLGVELYPRTQGSRRPPPLPRQPFCCMQLLNEPADWFAPGVARLLSLSTDGKVRFSGSC